MHAIFRVEEWLGLIIIGLLLVATLVTGAAFLLNELSKGKRFTLIFVAVANEMHRQQRLPGQQNYKAL